MALTATKLPASPSPGVYTNGFLSAKVNEIIDEAAPTQAFKLDRTTTTEYTLTTFPTLPATIDTGVNPATVQTTADTDSVDITVSFLFSGGGNTYVLYKQTTAAALLAYPLARVLDSGEAEGVTGDATINYWYDSTSNDIKVLIDFDGGGKTAVSLTVTSGYNTPIPT